MKTQNFSIDGFKDFNVTFGKVLLNFTYDADQIGLGLALNYDRELAIAEMALRLGPVSVSGSYDF